MRYSLPSGLAVGVVLIFCRSAFGQDAPAREAKGLPPRAAPSDYQAHAQAGAITVAAEFTGHSVPTAEAVLSTEDYVAVEVGMFGPPAESTQLSLENFSIRINGKKTASPAQPYGLLFPSLKDPEWEPPTPPKPKSKTSMGSGGDQSEDSLPEIVHIPIEVKRLMQQRVQKAALPEGDRVLPQAGLVFFEYRGKTSGIRSVELIYSGPAGTTTLKLHP